MRRNQICRVCHIWIRAITQSLISPLSSSPQLVDHRPDKLVAMATTIGSSEKQAEIHTYSSPHPVYAMGWSVS